MRKKFPFYEEANEEGGTGNLAYMLPEKYLVTQIIPYANF